MTTKKIRTPALPLGPREQDRQLVQRAVETVEAIPVANPWVKGAAKTPGGRQRITRQLAEGLGSSVADLERLQAEFIPEARLPGPCTFRRNPTRSATPLSNLLDCYTACLYCCEEARRALHLILRGLMGEKVYGDFLPPEVIAARIVETQMRADREARERGPRMVTSMRVVANEDGGVTFIPGEKVPAGDPREFQFEGAGKELPLALRKYARHLITWADLVGFLQKHGIHGVSKEAKKIRAAMPTPTFKAPSRRSFYRFAFAVSAARKLSSHPEKFDLLGETDWLRERLQPPEFRPEWASDPDSRAGGRKKTGRQAAAKRR